jgi:hypothetical protein
MNSDEGARGGHACSGIPRFSVVHEWALLQVHGSSTQIDTNGGRPLAHTASTLLQIRLHTSKLNNFDGSRHYLSAFKTSIQRPTTPAIHS